MARRHARPRPPAGRLFWQALKKFFGALSTAALFVGGKELIGLYLGHAVRSCGKIAAHEKGPVIAGE